MVRVFPSPRRLLETNLRINENSTAVPDPAVAIMGLIGPGKLLKHRYRQRLFTLDLSILV